MAEGFTREINTFAHHFSDSRKSLERLLRTAGAYDSWFSYPEQDLNYNLHLTQHLGTNGLLTPGRTPDVEGARTIVGSFLHPAGLVAATLKHKFTLLCERTPETGRLRLAPARPTPGLQTGPKILLIYYATPYHLCSFQHKLNSTSTISDRDVWIKQILPTIPRLEPIPSMVHDMEMEVPNEVEVPPGPTQNNWDSLLTPIHRGHTNSPALTLGTRTPWGLSWGPIRRTSQPASSRKTASMNQTGDNDLELHARGLAYTGTSIGTAGESQL